MSRQKIDTPKPARVYRVCDSGQGWYICPTCALALIAPTLHVWSTITVYARDTHGALVDPPTTRTTRQLVCVECHTPRAGTGQTRTVQVTDPAILTALSRLPRTPQV